MSVSRYDLWYQIVILARAEHHLDRIAEGASTSA